MQAHFVTSISTSVRARTRITQHQHLDHELIVVQKGDYRCWLSQTELRLRAGEALLVRPGDWHTDELFRGLQYHAVTFQLSAAVTNKPIAVFADGTRPESQHLRNAPAHLLHSVLRLQATTGDTRRCAAHLQHALMHELLWSLISVIPNEALHPLARHACTTDHGEALRQCFHRHLHRRPSLATLARELGTSVRALHGQCRDHFGLSPSRAFARYQMHHAARLLRETDMSVAAVAENLGFVNPYHFSTAFKRVHGFPPSQILS